MSATIRAAVYARYSTDEQREASIGDQFRGCDRIALANDLTIVARFEDRGISGGTSERPGYQSLLQTARAGAFEVIIVEDFSRLWRNRSESGQRSAELEDLGIHVLTCVGDDTRRDGWGLVFQIKAALAEHARREISYRTRRGMEGKALAGGSTGGRAYGYASPGVVSPTEAAVVRQAFERYVAGWSAARIASDLNRARVPAPRGPVWYPSTVGGLLRNPRYAGTVQWGGSVSQHSARDSRHTRRVARPELAISREAPELALVPAGVWKAAAARRAAGACNVAAEAV